MNLIIVFILVFVTGGLLGSLLNREKKLAVKIGKIFTYCFLLYMILIGCLLFIIPAGIGEESLSVIGKIKKTALAPTGLLGMLFFVFLPGLITVNEIREAFGKPR